MSDAVAVAFWRATDILGDISDDGLASCLGDSYDVAPGQVFVMTGQRCETVVGVLHGSITMNGAAQSTGSVVALQQTVLGEALPHAIIGGPAGAVLSLLPLAEVQQSRLRPAARDNGPCHTGVPAPLGLEHFAADPELQSPKVMWRRVRRALASMMAPDALRLLCGALALALLALAAPFFTLFSIDRVVARQMQSGWAAFFLCMVAVIFLQNTLLRAMHGVLLSHASEELTQPGLVHACLVLLRVPASLALMGFLACYCLPMAAVALAMGGAGVLMLYITTPWQTALNDPLTDLAWLPQNRDTANNLAEEGIVAPVARHLTAHQSPRGWRNPLLWRAQTLAIVAAYFAAGLQALALAVGTWMLIRGAGSLGQLAASAVAMNAIANQLLATLRRSHLWPDLMEREPAPPQPPMQTAAEAWDGTLQLVNVTAGYLDSAPPALRHCSINLAAGEALGITGHSGAGKSCLARVLAGRLSCREGAALAPQSWADTAALLELHTPMDGGRLDLWLTQGAPMATQEILKALALAGVDGTFNALPRGFHSHLRFDDARLCKSQRVRLRIAQMLLSQPRLCVLDEVLDILDTTTAHCLLTNIKRHLPKSSVVLVSRRGSLLRRCSKVALLQNGSMQACDIWENIAPGCLLPPLVHDG